ncbi:MAG: Dabb family protein [SAR324 cluster bacterium]|nr:Dabb family protein [SAR324 cluster bacterium]
MIKHIVMFKLKIKTEENLNLLKDKLEALKDKIDLVQYLEVGIDILGKERSMDLVLTTHFKSVEDLILYANHEEHLKVLEWIGENTSLIKAVDFEV